jgi:hypothetical protein
MGIALYIQKGAMFGEAEISSPNCPILDDFLMGMPLTLRFMVIV